MNLLFLESKIKLKMVGITLPVRSVVMKSNDRVLLISPIDFSAEQIQQIKNFGKVTDIIAPVLIHHLFIPKAKKLFPAATLWGVAGFHEKRPDILWEQVLTEENHPPCSDIEFLAIKGVPRLNEMVFLHKPTKTLLVSDLVFNLQSPEGFMAPVLLRMLGTYKKLNVSRFIQKMVQDRPALQLSLQRILAWDFEGIAMSHGDIVESGGKTRLSQTFQDNKLL